MKLAIRIEPGGQLKTPNLNIFYGFLMQIVRLQLLAGELDLNMAQAAAVPAAATAVAEPKAEPKAASKAKRGAKAAAMEIE